MSGSEFPRVYQQFCEGRESLGWDEFDVEEDDFAALTQAAPYPEHITCSPAFFDEWPVLASALHGYLARRYLTYCNELSTRCCRVPEYQLISTVDSRYHELVVEYNKLKIVEREAKERGDRAGMVIANQNIIWCARMAVYAVEDIVELKRGNSYLLNTLAERKWRIGHPPQVQRSP